MSYMPILSIEIEGVKHQLLHALSDHADEFSKIIREEVEALDLEEMIRLRVRQQIPRVVQEAVDTAVGSIARSVVAEARWNEALGVIVRDAIQRATDELLTPEQEGS